MKPLSSGWFALAGFVCGLICILIFLTLDFFFHQYNRLLWLAGAMMWNCVFLILVNSKYRQRAPIFTRGGLVRYEDHPVKYRVAYGVLYLFGGGFLLALVLIVFFP